MMSSNDLAVFTGTTCGANCWYAREETCRCSCGGFNHGILKTEDGEQPVRAKRVKNKHFELEAVVIGYGGAHDHITKELGQQFGGQTAEWCKVGEYISQGATKSQLNWAELKGMEKGPTYGSHPYLIWKRVR